AMLSWVESLFHEQTDWESLKDNNLLPKKLLIRLKNTRSRLDNIDGSIETLKQKIAVINEAHDAAENLPTVLEELEAAKEQLELSNESAKNDSLRIKKEINEI